MKSPMKTKHSCRACGGSNLELILSLGTTPLANSLLEPADLGAPEPRFPLDLAFCADCTLLQITETVPPEKLFSDYLYFSSFSDTMLKHAEALVTRMHADEKLGANSLAAEIASNDGYLLQYYKRLGVPVLGIDPAENVAKVAVEQRGVRTLTRFFGEALGKELAERGERADVIHANNVFAHVADLNGFCAGIAHFLKDRGVASIEFPYAKDFLDHCEFDTIYHEHLCYYSLTAVDHLLRRHGLVVRDVERIPMHGGSLRLFVSHARAFDPGPRTKALLAEEKAWNVDKVATYRGFARRVETLRSELKKTLAELKGQGKRIAAYGAAAKGATLLNYFGIGKDLVDFVVDRSTYKQGRLMPGVHIPIFAPPKLLEDKPDYCLLLTWNFEREILEQQRAYREQGGKFIVPIPEVRVT
jgi:SAM-dependent methyltransferase